MNGNNKIIAVYVKPVISSYREVVAWRGKKGLSVPMYWNTRCESLSRTGLRSNVCDHSTVSLKTETSPLLRDIYP